MLGNDDNSIKINVNKGGNGTPKGTVSIGINEYTAILELAFKAVILKEAIFAQAAPSCDGKSLICGVYGDIARYIFPEEYAKKLEELNDKEVSE